MGARFQIPVEMPVQIPVGFFWPDPYQSSRNFNLAYPVHFDKI